MSLDLTDSLPSFVDSESTQQGFASSTDFVLDLIKKEQDRAHVRALIDEGETSPSQEIDIDSYIATLRNRFNTKKRSLTKRTLALNPRADFDIEDVIDHYHAQQAFKTRYVVPNDKH